MKTPKLNRTTIGIIVAVLVTGGIAAWFAFRTPGADAAKAAPAKPTLTVTTVLPEKVTLPVKLSANGTITAWQETIVGSESNGLRLTQVLVNVGDPVREGQVMAVLSGDSVQAEVAQARASLAEAQATAADAADNAARARTLQDSGALSTQQIRQYATAEQTARARAEAAKAVLEAQELIKANEK